MFIFVHFGTNELTTQKLCILTRIEVTAIIPSFPYARQDKKSKSRDAITGLIKFI